MIDKAARLDTGMRVDEAIDAARKWWTEWRGAIARGFNAVEDKPTVRPGVPGAPAFVIAGESRQDLPSGILSGLPWDELSEREQLQVVKTWHHFRVRDPMAADFEYREALERAAANAPMADKRPH